MSRYGTLVWIGIGCSAAAWAQTDRENYRVPYLAWRQAAPALETDASAPTPTFAAEVGVAAQNAQTFFSARAAYLTAAQPNAAEQTAWASKPMASAETLLTTPQSVEQLLAVRAARLGNEMNVFKADDKDAAIRRVRQAMERERAALRALNDALTTRKTLLTELIEGSDEAEIARATVFQVLNAANVRRTQVAEHVKREATAWDRYYADLATAAVATTTATPAAAPAKILRAPTAGQIPMTRYTGEWLFPNKGLFFGPQPESVEMTIQESGGSITGTLSAKFLTPARTVKFDFQGPVSQQTRTQTFAVQTDDGGMGSVELIPGSAINLLEVNFAAIGLAGNFILVKR
jgi:hypothetical protein